MPLLKEFDVQDDCLIVRLTGDLDHHETDAFREEWMTYFTNYPINHVILSLKGVEFIYIDLFFFPFERSEFLNFRQKIFTTNLADLARFADTIHAFTGVWCISAPFY